MREHAPFATCFSDIQGGVHEFSFSPLIGAMLGEIGFKFSPFLIGEIGIICFSYHIFSLTFFL